MKKPKSELPWKANECKDDIVDQKDTPLYTSADCPGGCYFYEKEDVEYIVQACNNFPKAIELLRLYHKGATCKEKLYLSEVGEFLKEIEK